MAENNTTIKGISGNIADVNDDNYLKVYAPTGIHAASLKGNAYIWNAVSANIDTTDCMILVANTSATQNLVIHSCMFRGDIAGQLDFKTCSVAGLTLAGTAITGINLNAGSNKAAPASAFSDETASPATDIIFTWYQHLCVNAQTTTGPMGFVNFDDAIIIGYNRAFGIDTILEPAAGFEASVIGYFIDA